MQNDTKEMAQQFQSQGSVQEKTCILLTEDEAIVRMALVATLEDGGIASDQILVAENGAQAIEIYEKNKDRIAVVLTDHDMPDKNGLELMTHIHNDAQGLQPLLMMQSSRFTETAREIPENHDIIAAVDDLNGIAVPKGGFEPAHMRLILAEMNKPTTKTPQAETIAPEFIATPGV